MPSGERSAITPMAALLTLLISTALVTIYDDATSIPSRGRGQTQTEAARQVGQEGRQMKDFHVYAETDAAGVKTLSIVMDPADPQKADVLEAVAAVMNEAGRSREADECLKAKNW